jgi:hypothetical protein
MRSPLAALLIAGCAFDRGGVPARDGEAIDAAGDSEPADAATDAPADAAPDAAPCPLGYAPIPGGPAPSQYRIATSGKAWRDAELDCEDDGPASHLAILGDDAERDAVRGAIAGAAWLGVTDIVAEGTWFKVTTGIASYRPWNSGEPNDFFGEDCVELDGGGFNDENCTANDVYICECDGVAANPIAYTAP